jgi:hypothetical protein
MSDIEENQEGQQGPASQNGGMRAVMFLQRHMFFLGRPVVKRGRQFIRLRRHAERFSLRLPGSFPCHPAKKVAVCPSSNHWAKAYKSTRGNYNKEDRGNPGCPADEGVSALV